MRLTPAQIAVRLICGERPSHFTRASNVLAERMKEGHDWLVRMTGKDFGYDLQAWHEHLKESREGGYTYGRNIVTPKIMGKAMRSPEWQEAAQRLAKKVHPLKT